MTKVQCSGITVKKVRCKIKLENGNYCSYHLAQDPEYKGNFYCKYDKVDNNRKCRQFKVENSDYCEYHRPFMKKNNWDFIVDVKIERSSLQYVNLVHDTIIYEETKVKTEINRKQEFQILKNGSNSIHSDVNMNAKHHQTTTKYNTDNESKKDNRRGKQPRNEAYPAGKSNSGSIYIFTFKQLSVESSSKKDWISIKPYHLKKMEVFDPKHFMLIKVGYTEQTVEKRLQQWNDKCEHEITLVDLEFLENTLPSKLKTLITKPMKLNSYKPIEKPNYRNKDNRHHIDQFSSRIENFIIRTRSRVTLENEKLRTFQDGNGFHCKSDAAIIEKKIHKFLGDKFGKILVNCEACSIKSKSGKAAHIEWFLIPKLQLINVFYAIDKFCYEYPLKKESAKLK